MAVLRTGETVDHFVDGAVAAAGDDELAAVVSGAARDFGRFAGAGGFREIRLNAASAEDSARFFELGAASRATSTRVWIVNQQRVLQILHRSL